MALLDTLAIHSQRYWAERGDELHSQVAPVSPTLSSSGSDCSSSVMSSSGSPSPPPRSSSCSPDKSPTTTGRARKPYRMASNFELSDEQPAAIQQPRRSRNKGDSFVALFGPAPARSRPQRSVSAAPAPAAHRRRKPLPVNPLTGETLGQGGGVDVPPSASAVVNPQGFTRFKRPPPGGYTSPLW